MKWRKAAQQERAGHERGASEMPWPLPLKGIHAEAKRSEVNGTVAVLLHNLRSSGIAIKTRDGYVPQGSSIASQRIPFEFGATKAYIEIFGKKATCGAAQFSRLFPRRISYTGISNNVVMADGGGLPLRFDGATFTPCAFTAVGASPSKFTGVHSHQDRLYFWSEKSLDFYYGDVGAVMGILTHFPLSRLGNISGHIKLMTSMTVNAAHGMNDILVIVTSTGWVILYEGLNPGDAGDWRLLGRVKTAPPIDQDCVVQFGSDLWFLTARGVVSVRETLAQGVMALITTVARPISEDLVKLAAAYGGKPHWQMVARADGEEVIINIPTDSGMIQYVYDAAEQAWMTSDYPAKSFHVLGIDTDFTGNDGRLYRITKGACDDGQKIRMSFHSGWMRVGRSSAVSYLLPTITAQGELEATITVLGDHHETAADIARAKQVLTLRPQSDDDPIVINEVIGSGATGRVFQLRMEFEGRGVSIEHILVGAQ